MGKKSPGSLSDEIITVIPDYLVNKEMVEANN